MRPVILPSLLIAIVLGLTLQSVAQPPPALPEKPAEPAAEAVVDTKLLAPMQWRSIGPTSMGGRIVALAVVESNPSTYWVASASGGLFKTVNAGVTFEPQFQQAGSISIGDVCVAPSNQNVVWVGTGEHNARNSVSWGDGVYKSVDGGKTFKHMGLKESFQIGRIAIHPKNPDIVYVGALGRLWGENEERGLFKTTDGGKTWKKIHYIDDKTGVIDVQMDPKNPDTLIIATYERKRDIYDGGDPVKRFAPGTGIYKTTDGGKTWKKLTKGLPTVKMGRIGIEYFRSNPKHVFAIIETERSGTAPKGTSSPAYMGIQGDRRTSRLTVVTPNGPSAKAGLKAGDEVIEMAGKKIASYDDIIKQIRAHKAGDTIPVKVKRGDKTVTLKLTFGSRGGRNVFGGRLGGQRENVQNRQGKQGFQTGGVYKSTDGGESWKRVNSLNPRPFYFSQIRVDPTDDRYVYVMGISLYRSFDGGKTFRSDAGRSVHPDHHAMWIDPRDGRHIILGCDGGLNITWDRTRRWEFLNNLPIGQFYDVGVDTRTPYRVYGGLQDNGSWGGPSRTRSSRGPMPDHFFAVGGGDGFICRVDPEDPNTVYYESQYGNLQRVDLKTGARARIRPGAPRGVRYRFNWKTPFLLSNHNSRIYYSAGNYVFKSLKRGAGQKRISPEITRTKRGTATALAESPRDPNVLYVGTDDGWLWGTRDGGRSWGRLSIPGRDGNRRVNAIEPSRFVAGRCYVTLDGHYFDSDDPDVWVTEDYGQTWKSLNATLPKGCTRVLREDVVNRDLLYLGTEFGMFCSLDRGKNWTRLNQNLPHVAIHEIAVHPTAGEIVAATHGRSLWILDVNALRQLTEKVRDEDVAFLKPATAVQWHTVSGKRYYGSKRFTGQNPQSGVALCYTLKDKPQAVSLTISDIEGNELARLRPTRTIGLNAVSWNLRRTSRRRGGRMPRNLAQIPQQLRQRFMSRFGSRVQPGVYLATLTIDGVDHKQRITVIQDPEYSTTDSLTYEESEWLRKMAKELDD